MHRMNTVTTIYYLCKDELDFDPAELRPHDLPVTSPSDGTSTDHDLKSAQGTADRTVIK